MNTTSEIKDKISSKLLNSPIKLRSAVLYGSWARDAQTQDSDVDILIIADQIHTKKHKRGREIAEIKECLSLGLPLDIMLLTSDECISNFRNHNPLFLDISHDGVIIIDDNGFIKKLMFETVSYVREKKIEKLDDGWRFPVLWRTPSYLSEVSNRDFASAMFADGERDFNIGMNLMRDGYYDKSVYHFQQAVEKSVKAVLISFGEFKKTHFVGEILTETLKTVELEQSWKEKLLRIARSSEEIEPEVTWSRYPGIDNGRLWIPHNEYVLDDAKEVKEKTEAVVKTAKDFIQWWFM